MRRIFSFLVRHWKFSVPSFVVLVGVVVWLVFFYFAFHLIFIDKKVNENVFVFTSGATMEMSSTTIPAGTSPPPTTSTSISTSSTSSGGANTTQTTVLTTTTSTAPPNSSSNCGGAQISGGQVTCGAPAEFIRRSHPASGQAFFITDGFQNVLRIENLRTDNGPDLNVYLVPVPANSPEGQFDDDFVDLGDLTGNIGSDFYVIPDGTDINKYSTVVIWCVRFSVAFGAADLNSL